jgi:aspartyl-tRNA(Asn)/glutamyl-tRNA(Gln) amidotransferase subunit C
MVINIETVQRVANLARIHVTRDELIPLSAELSNILEFMQQLNAVDVEGVLPLTSVTPMELNLRADNVTDGGKVVEILMNAPKHSEGFFAVPKVIE